MAHAEGLGLLGKKWAHAQTGDGEGRAVQLRNVEFGGQSRRKLMLHAGAAGGLS